MVPTFGVWQSYGKIGMIGSSQIVIYGVWPVKMGFSYSDDQ